MIKKAAAPSGKKFHPNVVAVSVENSTRGSGNIPVG